LFRTLASGDLTVFERGSFGSLIGGHSNFARFMRLITWSIKSFEDDPQAGLVMGRAKGNVICGRWQNKVLFFFPAPRSVLLQDSNNLCEI